MKKNWEITFTIPNPIYSILTSRRRYLIKRFIDSKSEFLFSQLKSNSKGENTYFYWSQLVPQEISMYIRLAEQVEKKEFDDLCKRRGFDDVMSEFLRDAIIFVGLGKKLENNAATI